MRCAYLRIFAHIQRIFRIFGKKRIFAHICAYFAHILAFLGKISAYFIALRGKFWDLEFSAHILAHIFLGYYPSEGRLFMPKSHKIVRFFAFFASFSRKMMIKCHKKWQFAHLGGIWMHFGTYLGKKVQNLCSGGVRSPKIFLSRKRVSIGISAYFSAYLRIFAHICAYLRIFFQGSPSAYFPPRCKP